MAGINPKNRRTGTFLRTPAEQRHTWERSAGIREDKATFTLSFADGSTGTVHYLANGHKDFPKERLELFCGERILVLDNFRRLVGHGWKGFREERLWRQDKGHAAEVAAFISAVVRPGDGIAHLKESGYIRVQKDSAVLLLDVGPLGPDYLPAHGHADTLSFEMALHGQRVIVDSGVSRYDNSPGCMPA